MSEVAGGWRGPRFALRRAPRRGDKVGRPSALPLSVVMQKIWREVFLYFLALFVGGLLMSAVSFALVRTTYAGVSDEGAVQAGVAAYPEYLAAVARAMALLGVAQVLALFAATSGLVALFDWVRVGSAPTTSPLCDARVWVKWLAIALAVHLLWLGAEARRHPGLFLPLLSASAAAPICLALARFMWPLVLVASAVGWARFAMTAMKSSGALVGAAGAMTAVLWMVIFELAAGRPSPTVSAARASQRTITAVEHSYPKPNILLLGVDSLRPDKIDTETTPVLARLVRDSVYFPNTLVTLPRTAPSWAALLTSLPPLANGVETMFPTAARSELGELAMPAHLASLGYATTVVSEYAGESFARLRLGFQKTLVPRVELEQMLGQGLLARQPVALGFAGQLYTAPGDLAGLLPAPVPELMRGLASFGHPRVLGADLARELDPSRPWFAMVFYSQPHFPYTSSSPFDGKYAVNGADSALRFGKDVTHGDVRTDADRAQIDGLYRAALGETDAAIGDLLARLDQMGALDDTIVILTADHGEGLYECPACVGHGDNLTGMMSLRVPLSFRLPPRRFPAVRATTVPAHVSHLDVYPTLLALLDVPRPPVQEGTPLLTRDGSAIELPVDRIFFAESGEWLWPTPAVPSARIAYPPITTLARIEEGRIVIDEPFLPVIRAAKHRAAILPPFKLLYVPTQTGVAWRLYDIEHDPHEETDVSDRHPEMTARLRAALRHSVLRFSHMLPAGDYFLTRPAAPLEEYY